MRRRKRIDIAAEERPTIYGDAQRPDTAPGPYYVVLIDGARWEIVSGPYLTHAEALGLVDQARLRCEAQNWRAAFYRFVTARMRPDFSQPGSLQTRGWDLALTEQTAPAASKRK